MSYCILLLFLLPIDACFEDYYYSLDGLVVAILLRPPPICVYACLGV
jgi:hypothetical protein